MKQWFKNAFYGLGFCCLQSFFANDVDGSILVRGRRVTFLVREVRLGIDDDDSWGRYLNGWSGLVVRIQAGGIAAVDRIVEGEGIRIGGRPGARDQQRVAA